MKGELLTDDQVAAMRRDAAGDPGKYWDCRAIRAVCEHVEALAADREKLYRWIMELENDLHRMHEV